MRFKFAICFGFLFFTVATVQADIFDLKWVETVQQIDGAHPAIIGERFTTTIKVDNGGTSTLSQIWQPIDFVSYRIDGASGWSLETVGTNVGSGAGTFSTDALGNVITAGNWSGNWPNDLVSTSWTGVTLGGWWNNGFNQVSGTNSPFDLVWANNVGGNLVGSNWTVSPTAVPEPSSLAVLGILGIGAVGFGFRRRKR